MVIVDFPGKTDSFSLAGAYLRVCVRLVKEVDALFRERVVQEIERIEEAVRENGSLREFAWRTARHRATLATFRALIGSTSELPALAGAAAGGLPILSVAGVKTLLDRRDKLREIMDNQLYFYYRAGERIGRRLGGK
jgi:hypothetical protein